MKTRFVRWLAHDRWPFVLAGLALIATLPALGNGLTADDYIHRAVLTRAPIILPNTSPVMDLFRFFPGTVEENQWLRDNGYLPWWSSPEVRARFLRPLSAISHILDYRLWPDNFVLQHAHSLLWYALGVFMVSWLFRAIHGPTAVAGLAGLMFAVEDAHALPAGWLANRNASLALVFGAIALLLHIRWRRERRIGYLFAALVSLGVGLLSAEIALCAAAYLFAWEICLGDGRWIDRFAGLAHHLQRSRLRDHGFGALRRSRS